MPESLRRMGTSTCVLKFKTRRTIDVSGKLHEPAAWTTRIFLQTIQQVKAEKLLYLL
jgi:hypothetical protein